MTDGTVLTNPATRHVPGYNRPMKNMIRTLATSAVVSATMLAQDAASVQKAMDQAVANLRTQLQAVANAAEKKGQSEGTTPTPTPTPDPTPGGTTPSAPIQGYSLAFSDDFNSTSNWYPSYWWNSCIPPSSNITTNGGILNLHWTRDEKCGNGKTATETSISTLSHDTKTGKTFTYGYFEARMRWDVANGAWPAFWMIPIEASQGAQDTGEVDIFEGEGGDPRQFFGTLHEWGPPNGQTAKWSNSPNNYPANVDFSQWHTYGFLWTSDNTATWYLDGKALNTVKNIPSVFGTQKFFLVLSMQEGANWSPGNVASNTPQQLNLGVDWVRVWQKK